MSITYVRTHAHAVSIRCSKSSNNYRVKRGFLIQLLRGIYVDAVDT